MMRVPYSAMSIVGDEHDGQTLVPVQPRRISITSMLVCVSRLPVGLVGKQQLLGCSRARGNRHALLLAAGELVR